MRGDEVGGPIRWRLHIPVPPERVYDALDSDADRASFWAEAAVERDGVIDFSFPGGINHCAPLLARELNVLLPLKAWLAHGLDLRSHDPRRTWAQGYVDP